MICHFMISLAVCLLKTQTNKQTKKLQTGEVVKRNLICVDFNELFCSNNKKYHIFIFQYKLCHAFYFGFSSNQCQDFNNCQFSRWLKWWIDLTLFSLLAFITGIFVESSSSSSWCIHQLQVYNWFIVSAAKNPKLWLHFVKFGLFDNQISLGYGAFLDSWVYSHICK